MKLIEAKDIPQEEWDTKPGEHGKIVEIRFEAYHDVIIYEDGYEERYYIGD